MRNVLFKSQIFTNGDMSGNLTSLAQSIFFLDNIALQLNFTGTPTGVFQVQGSVDYKQDYLGNIINVGNWVGLTLDPIPSVSGSADQILIDLNQLGFNWLRVVYLKTSGTGVLNGYISGKGL